MLFKSLAAVVAASTLVQALPPQEERRADDHPNLATTTVTGFEVVIVYATPEGGCTAAPTACPAQFPTGIVPAALPAKEEPEDDEPTATAASAPSASYTRPAPTATLKPNRHWDCDSKPAKNVIPVPAEEGSKMYYGNGDPTKAGEYAWLTYFFNRPSVNLDDTDHVTDIVYGPEGLVVRFASDEAWDFAVDTWSEKDGLVLITFTEGCGAYESQDRCFFKVTSITWNKRDHSIIAKGKPTHPEEVVSKGESEWGYYVPRGDGPKGGAPKPSGTKSATSPTSTGKAPSNNPGAGGCVPPVDTKYGLPTACFGNSFDLDLDSFLGSEDLSDEYQEFLERLFAEDETFRNSSAIDRREAIIARGWFKDHIIEPIKDVFDSVQDALTVSADIDKDFSFKVPDSGSELLDFGLDFVTSPWGEAIKLYSANIPQTEGLDGHVNIYCVGCGVSGSARLYGKATWVPFKGITEGFIEVSNDLQFAVKIGIDAEVTFSHNIHYDLFSVGLPGLSFGVITIGPRIDLGANVGLEASASGKLLAGAEMGIQNAVARLDFVNSGNTKATGWEPFFTPVFEAEGRIKASASLGLPVGIHCGIKIATFDLSAGIVDEPSIKGTAEVAAKVSIGEDGQLEGGIVETNGCAGISGQLSWRNKLYVKITGFDNKDLLDTNDRVLKEVCIPIGSQDGGDEPATDPPATDEPATDPPATDEPVADPPVTDEPVTDPPVADPPVSDEPVADPPADEPVADPPVSETPETPVETPIVEDPDTDVPIDNPDDDTPVVEAPHDTPGVETPGSPSTPSPVHTPSVSGAPVSLTATTLTTPAASTASASTVSKVLTSSALAGNGTVSATPTSTSRAATPTKSSTPSAGAPVQDEDGLEYGPLISSSSSTKIGSCSNGNLYVFDIKGRNTPSCSDIWAFRDEALVADGSSRALHYYNNTMSVLGVSRLRIEDEAKVPGGSIIVAWAPYGEKASDKVYLAVDPQDQIFYPLACEYENGSGSKVFLAKDPVKGAELLKSKDVQHSITGGKVSGCFPLRLLKGDSFTYGYGVSH